MRIALLGDVALSGVYDVSSSDSVFPLIQNIRNIIENCDYVICNLESPLTHQTKTHMCKGVYLRSAPQNVEVLKYLGITHVTLANNHVFDYGKKAAQETIKILEENNIGYCGLCGDPLFLSKGEDKVLVDGFCCYSANGIYYGEKPLAIKTLSFSTMKEFLDEANSKKCFPVASVHYGIERLHYPAPEHMRLFRGFSENYNYVLHGNHTHSIQGYEKYKDSLFFYSLGNLLFDDVKTTSVKTSVKQNKETRKTYIVIIEVKENQLSNYRIIPMQGNDIGELKQDRTVGDELYEYSQKLVLSYEDISRLRAKETELDKQGREKRDTKFIVNRLNYKYIGAYLNGRIHKKKYNAVFRDFF